MGAKKNVKLPFSWSLLKWLISKSLIHALADLGYLPKLKKGVRLVYTSDFLHTSPIETFLIKYPIKWPNFKIWGEWPSRLRCYIRIANPIRLKPHWVLRWAFFKLIFGCFTAKFGSNANHCIFYNFDLKLTGAL